MNRDEGQYQLSHIFDELLVTPGSVPGKNNLATLQLHRVVVIATHSSVVEKDDGLHRNVHT